MTQQEPRSSDSQFESQVHPLNIFKPEWKLLQQSIQMNNLIFEHHSVLDEEPEGLDYPPLNHHLIGCLLTSSISTVSRIGQETYEGLITRGDFFVNPSGYSGSHVHVGGNKIETLIFIVKPDFLVQIAAESECLNPDKIELYPIIKASDSQLEYITHAFFHEIKTKALGGRIYSETLAIQFAIHLLRNYCIFPAKLKQYSGGLSSRKLQIVIDYIDANLEESISLNDLSQVAQINSSHYFCKLFKQSTGFSPYQYVMLQRVNKAKQLLKNNNLTLVEIAFRCGFSSQSSFSRAFRKLIGISPQKYKQQF